MAALLKIISGQGKYMKIFSKMALVKIKLKIKFLCVLAAFNHFRQIFCRNHIQSIVTFTGHLKFLL